MSLSEKADKERNDDKNGPPSFVVEAYYVEYFQNPDDSEKQECDAANDFSCLVHVFFFFTQKRGGGNIIVCVGRYPKKLFALQYVFKQTVVSALSI